VRAAVLCCAVLSSAARSGAASDRRSLTHRWVSADLSMRFDLQR
jgi:hypothetical protein